MGEERSDTELVLAAREEDPAAFGQLFERWFDRSWNVARTILRDDDLAADVAQDTMVKAWQQLDQLQDPDAFGGWLLRSTRNRALNRLAREGRSRATGDDVVSGLRDRGGDDPVGAERQPEPDLVNEIRDRQELVWAAATALGERDVSLLDLHLRHGLSPAEIAEELGVEANAAHQQLFRLRGRLGDAIGSYLLWRNGRPLCDGLAEAVSGRTAFDRSVAKAVARHQANCEHCSGERESMVDPSKLFAAVPLLLVPPHLKAEAAAALQSVGVPTDGSAANADAGSADAGSGDAGSGSSGSPGDAGSGTSGSPGDAGSGTSGSPGDGAGQAGGGPSGDGTGVGGSGNGGPAGSPGEGMRLDLAGPGQPPPAPVATAPGTTLAQEVVGSSPGPSSLAPSLVLPRGRAVALAGVGVVAIAALVAIGALILRDGDTGDGVAAIASDTPEPLAAAQDGGGDDAPGGPASFAPSSTTAASTTQSATDSTEERRSTFGSSATPSSAETSTTATTATTSLSTTETTDVSTTPTTGTTRTTPTTGTTRTTPTTGTTRTTPTTGTSTTDPFVTSSSLVTITVTVSVTNPPVDPPIVIRFTSRISRTTLQCLRNQRTYDAIWFAEFTDSVSVSLPGTTARGGPEGSVQFCGEAGQTISITARGPGGTDTASTTL